MLDAPDVQAGADRSSSLQWGQQHVLGLDAARRAVFASFGHDTPKVGGVSGAEPDMAKLETSGTP